MVRTASAASHNSVALSVAARNDERDGPVYVHCEMGQRASALALIAMAPETG